MLWAVAAAVLRPIAEPDEGRYAEAAREMLVTGDWLLPRQGGVLYPDKPPGGYWLMAASMAVLGPTALAARLPALLAFIGLLALLWRTEGRREEAAPGLGPTAAWMTAACPLTVALAQLATLDMLLTFFTTAGILAGRRWLQGGPRAAAWAAGAALGYGFLVKGPVAWALPLAILAVAALADGRGRSLRRLLSPHFWAPLLAVGLSWYLVAAARVPELKDYWIGSELIGRVAGSHGRGKPVWYFPALALGITLPWAAWAAWRGYQRRRRGQPPPGDPEHRFYAIWALLPVVFFTLPASKQPAYLAPAVPGLALWLAQAWATPDARRLRLGLTAVLGATYAVVLVLLLSPQRSRSDDPFAAVLHAAGAGDWAGAQLNGWSYGLTYRLERADLQSCNPIPKAWQFAANGGNVTILHDAEDRITCGLDHLARSEPAFLFLRELHATPRLPAQLQAAAEARGLRYWEWLRIEDRRLLVNRPPPAR